MSNKILLMKESIQVRIPVNTYVCVCVYRLNQTGEFGVRFY